MMLRLSLGLDDEAGLVERAVWDCVSAGQVTRDLGGRLTTDEAGEAVRSRLSRAAA
jgi:3-isopropylmalate dehydrogenase